MVRLSGPSLAALAEALTGRRLVPRHASLVAFRDADGSAIDRGIALYFRAPASFTGEDVLELQAHGSPMALQRLLRRCLQLGARPAQAGEFSLRAFLNDRMDLAQAEGVADLIDAATETAARAAVRSLEGELSSRIRGVRDALVALRTYVEATLDFPEEDVDFLRSADAEGQLERIRSALVEIIGTARSGRLLREGVHVVLIGRPNVGKSSLLNRFAGADVAIVTEVPGTTRDAIRQSIELDGVPLHVIDTAGLRATEDAVERIGIERAWSAVADADLALLLVDTPAGATDEDRAILDRLPRRLPRIVVRNKIDLIGQPPGVEPGDGEQPAVVRLSARTGAGIALLTREILHLVGYAPEEGVFLARERHLHALQEAHQHLLQAAVHLAGIPALELFAEELRLAQEALSSITGEFTPDDLLGEIFGRFCIGK